MLVLLLVLLLLLLVGPSSAGRAASCIDGVMHDRVQVCILSADCGRTIAAPCLCYARPLVVASV